MLAQMGDDASDKLVTVNAVADSQTKALFRS